VDEKNRGGKKTVMRGPPKIKSRQKGEGESAEGMVIRKIFGVENQGQRKKGAES